MITLDAAALERIIVELRGRYTNKDGITTILPNADYFPGEGNGLLQTGLEISLLAGEGALPEDATRRWVLILQDCKHETTPMLWRSKWKKNQDDTQKHDDYYGALSAGGHLGLLHPIQFFHYAESVGWFLNIQAPGKPDPAYYFDRILGFRAFCKAAALLAQRKILARGLNLPEGVPMIPPLTMREQLELGGALLWDAFIDVKKSDSCMKTACVRSVMREVSPTLGLVADFWRSRAVKLYGPLGHSFRGYFQGDHHPLTWRNWR